MKNKKNEMMRKLFKDTKNLSKALNKHSDDEILKELKNTKTNLEKLIKLYPDKKKEEAPKTNEKTTKKQP